MARLAAVAGPIRWGRVLALGATGFFLVMAVWEVPRLVGPDRLVGWLPFSDFAFYRSAAQHWLETGHFYLPDQLNGPYVVILDKHVLYPPPALLLFVPFVWLPAILWWVIPLGVIAYAFWRWRPAIWTWPILAAIVFWPKTESTLLLGNTDMWVAAGIAGGLLWGWPALLLVLKPTMAPLALIGVRRRSWWLAALVLGIVSIPLIPLWIEYVDVVRYSQIPWNYWVTGIPVALAPVVAWLGRTTGPTAWWLSRLRALDGSDRPAVSPGTADSAADENGVDTGRAGLA